MVVDILYYIQWTSIRVLQDLVNQVEYRIAQVRDSSHIAEYVNIAAFNHAPTEVLTSDTFQVELSTGEPAIECMEDTRVFFSEIDGSCSFASTFRFQSRFEVDRMLKRTLYIVGVEIWYFTLDSRSGKCFDHSVLVQFHPAFTTRRVSNQSTMLIRCHWDNNLIGCNETVIVILWTYEISSQINELVDSCLVRKTHLDFSTCQGLNNVG